MYHGTTENSPHKVGVLTVLRKSDYVLVKTECPMEEVIVVGVVVAVAVAVVVIVVVVVVVVVVGALMLAP